MTLALFDALEHLAGRPLVRARVVDVGAGTGIATALLAERCAHVLAGEPGDGMAEQFRRTLPRIPLVRGNGNALPLADSTADFITASCAPAAPSPCGGTVWATGTPRPPGSANRPPASPASSAWTTRPTARPTARRTASAN
ncbi:class I SAM-dependent methyltransferase [Streptomyces venezuelae]|uniref:class I SAM-dependent methyltransferase n=1 Tax=Streptomyces venezuelae TaxID=54571 RepID=UPI0037B2E95A